MVSTRREFLWAATALGVSQFACNPSPTPTPDLPKTPGTQRAAVNFEQLYQVATNQQCEEWCWAACMSMLFAFYGHQVSQQQIVLRTYGTIACLPAISSTVIGQALSSSSIDERTGVPFTSRIANVFDVMNGINTFGNTNLSIVNALNSNNPMLYANTQHAMVLYSVDYVPSVSNDQVVAANVVDPWPFSPKFHPLSQPELVSATVFGGQMMFLAEIQIS